MNSRATTKKAPVDLPFLLTEAVRSGRAILFLGAGASKECVNEKGDRPPNSDQLRDILSQKYFGKLMPNRDVMGVAELAIASGAGSSLVFETVNSAFQNFETSEAHRKVSDFIWNRIATTNYDTFLEKAYADSKRRRQVLIPFVKDDEPVDERMRSALNPLLYLKLHGCLEHRLDKDVPLVLSWESYASHSANRTRVFGRLTDPCHESPVIFVGYSLGDQHIRDLIYKLDGSKRPRWYIVDPNAEDEDVKYWDSKNVGVFKLRFGEFMDALDAAIPKLLRFVMPAVETIKFPIRDHYAISGSEESNLVRGSLEKDLTYIHATMPIAEQSAERFYSGYDTGWGGIVKRLDASRKVTGDLLFKALLENENPDGPVFFLLRGSAGAGKTISLKRAAFDAATANNAVVMWLNEAGQPRPDVFQELSELTRKPIYLFVDQVAIHIEKLVPFLAAMKQRKIPIVVCGAEREADWNLHCLPIENMLPVHSLRVGTLSSTEVELLLDLLVRHDCLGELKGKTRAQQVEAFMSEKHADRQLLVALHVLTKGLPFEDIVLNEYRSVASEQARRLYLDIATMNQYNVPVRAGTISRSSGIDFREYQEKFFKPLEDMILITQDPYTGDYAYKTRHSHVAKILFGRVCDDDDRKTEQFVRMINGFDVGFSSDQRALEGICKGRSFTDTFSDPTAVRCIYEAAITAAPKQAYLYQQWAIFESTHPGGDFLRAENLAEIASFMEPRNMTFLHTQAEVARKRANFETSLVLKDQLRRLSRSFLEKMPKNERFSASSRCKLLVDEVTELSDRLSDEEKQSEDKFFVEKLDDTEKAIAKAQHDFPDDAEMFETEARLWTEMKDKKKALKALERAWAKLPRGTGTGIRIGKIYAASGHPEKRLEILQEALRRAPEDKAAHQAMAMHFLETDPPDLELAISHLGRSFSAEDQNFEARYLLAQALFEKGDVEGTFQRFGELHKRAPKEFRRIAPRVDNAITARLPTYYGTIEEIREGYCFIRSGSYPAKIYAHRTGFDEATVGDLEVGLSVDFRMRFNRSGPVAVDIKVREQTANATVSFNS
ncbi:hypothetical protein HB780_21790 [Rhizobium lusitanum]|uniref:P-loop NTPase n=1 Tax=Rhizobium lusitanum TaxID=293958 RepID=UPI0016172594|nr:SIR2 family protein [Rhizobium lusitanum]QND48253.1 hypothetical protein HB780_21790 [Rhizobium lusitanum]